MESSEIISALFGSFLGLVFGLAAYDLKLRRDRQAALRGLLLRIGRPIYRNGETFKIIDGHYDEIVDICTGYEKCIYLFWNRRKFRRLFYRLIAHDPKTLKRHCVGAYPERDEAERIIEDILAFIGHPHERRKKQPGEN